MRRLVVLTALCVAMAAGQQFTCQEDEQCNSGLFCERATLQCIQCRRCDLLKRAAPPVPTACVRSVAECGPCFPGLVADQSGDVNSECVPPEPGAEGEASPYVWVAVALGVLLLALALAIVLCVLRHSDTIKIRASTRTSVQPGVAGGGATPASAPELPPPYNAHAHAHYSLQTDHDVEAQHDESSRLYAKPAPVNGVSREPAGNQAAFMYNTPAYVRTNQQSPRYDGRRISDVEESDDDTFTIHDEDTRESVWMPNENSDANINNTNNYVVVPPAGAVASSAASRGELPPSATKVICVLQQDTNNNRGESPSGAGAPPPGAAPPHHTAPPHPAPPAPAYVISVVQNINTLHQRNDVTL